MCELPPDIRLDLKAARSAWAQRLLHVDWSLALSWSWAARVCRRLGEHEREQCAFLAATTTFLTMHSLARSLTH